MTVKRLVDSRRGIQNEVAIVQIPSVVPLLLVQGVHPSKVSVLLVGVEQCHGRMHWYDSSKVRFDR